MIPLQRLMKNIRRFLLSGFAAALCYMSSGCATTYGSYEEQMRAREEKEAWAQMTPSEKAGDICGRCLLGMLSGWVASGRP